MCYIFIQCTLYFGLNVNIEQWIMAFMRVEISSGLFNLLLRQFMSLRYQNTALIRLSIVAVREIY